MNGTKHLPQHLMTLCACAILGLSSSGGLAQGGSTIPASQGKQAGFDITITDGSFTFNGEPTEATLQNVIDLLRTRHPDANIVIAPEVPPILIHNLKIRATDLWMELEALRVAGGDQFTWDTSGSPQFDPATGLPLPSAGQGLYVLRRGPSAAGQLRIEAFSLAGYFATLPKEDDANENEALIAEKIEELKHMVEETVEIFRAINDNTYGRGSSHKTSLTMRFHRGANLLILIGDPESIEIASKVIGALPNAQRTGGRMGYGEIDFGGFNNGGPLMGGRGTGYGMDPIMGGGGGGDFGWKFSAGMEAPARRNKAPSADEAQSR